MKHVVIWFIRAYQKSHPLRFAIEQNLHLPHATCKFSPTCSEFTLQSVQKYGTRKGIQCGLQQFMQCQPCTQRMIPYKPWNQL